VPRTKASQVPGKPSANVRRLRLGRKRKRWHRRPKRSRDELVAFLRQKKIRSSRHLEEVRTADDPNVYDYRREFGAWSLAMEQVDGPKVPTRVDPANKFEMASMVITFKLWRQADYMAFRKKQPDIAPPWWKVRKHWGRYSNLTRFAQSRSFKEGMLAFMQLRYRLGHWPTLKDCETNGIAVDAFLGHFGSKQKALTFLIDLVEKLK